MIEIKVPPLGESIVEATIARWLKNEGDRVEQDEVVVELETDKINVEVSAFKSGVLARRVKQEGDVVAVDEVLGEIDESAAASAPARKEKGKAESGEQKADAPPAKAAAPAASAADTGERRAAPAARRAAAERGVDVESVEPTGARGHVTKGDVLAHEERPAAAAPKSPGAGKAAAPTRAASGNGTRETREKMSTRRRRIAEHLLEASHATASLTTFNEVDMTAVMALRERLRERVQKEHDVKLTFMPFFMKAACMALKSYPVINSQVDGDAILYRHYVNLGIAVASDQGLVVPVVKEADTKGMIEMSRDLTDIAKRARDGKLTMDDLTGGTFTITNGGVFGSLVSTPILNYPQVGILGLHAINERPVAMQGEVVIRPMMYVALTYDHRIVDGQQAVLFLVRIKQLMEDPAAMLVE
jgi:2-oxoglutarate dehydrogenase E2 component (dihydrolipoamide succinyltransferase)